MSKTLQDLKEQVSTNFSEIDKLWAVSFRQNKPDIQKNVRAINGLKDELGGKITSMDRSVTEMSSQYKSILNELQTLREGLLRENGELITEIALLRGQVQNQADQQEAIRRDQASLTRQVKEINEAIAAIDRHRGQLAQKLNELENRSLSGGSPGS